MHRCCGKNFLTCFRLLIFLYLARTTSAYISEQLKEEVGLITDPIQKETDSVREKQNIEVKNTDNAHAEKEADNDNLLHDTKHGIRDIISIKIDIRSPRKTHGHRIHHRPATRDQDISSKKTSNNDRDSRREVNGVVVLKEGRHANEVADAGNSPRESSNSVRVKADITVNGQHLQQRHKTKKQDMDASK